MNERIRELYDQAIVIEDGGDYVCGELDPEKFAELIVRDCAGLCSIAAPGRDAEDIEEAILKHFGFDQ
jgi:hypothetical protein